MSRLNGKEQTDQPRTRRQHRRERAKKRAAARLAQRTRVPGTGSALQRQAARLTLRGYVLHASGFLWVPPGTPYADRHRGGRAF